MIKEGGTACMIGPVHPTAPVSRFFADMWMLFPKEEEYIEVCVCACAHVCSAWGGGMPCTGPTHPVFFADMWLRGDMWIRGASEECAIVHRVAVQQVPVYRFNSACHTDAPHPTLMPPIAYTHDTSPTTRSGSPRRASQTSRSSALVPPGTGEGETVLWM